MTFTLILVFHESNTHYLGDVFFKSLVQGGTELSKILLRDFTNKFALLKLRIFLIRLGLVFEYTNLELCTIILCNLFEIFQIAYKKLLLCAFFVQHLHF